MPGLWQGLTVPSAVAAASVQGRRLRVWRREDQFIAWRQHCCFDRTRNPLLCRKSGFGLIADARFCPSSSRHSRLVLADIVCVVVVVAVVVIMVLLLMLLMVLLLRSLRKVNQSSAWPQRRGELGVVHAHCSHRNCLAWLGSISCERGIEMKMKRCVCVCVCVSEPCCFGCRYRCRCCCGGSTHAETEGGGEWGERNKFGMTQYEPTYAPVL